MSRVDAAGLALKTGNALILKGGSEAFESNKCLAHILQKAVETCGLPSTAIQLVETTDREAVSILLKQRQYIDVVIPRGGAGLIQFVVNHSAVPALRPAPGIVMYILINTGKSPWALILFSTPRPNVLPYAMPWRRCWFIKISQQNSCRLWQKSSGKNLWSSGAANALAPFSKKRCPPTEEDWSTEYLDLIMAVKIVDSLDEAMAHIAKYGSGHSEAIITENYTRAKKFMDGVDAAAVYVNASTRFTDGNEFGFGAESASVPRNCMQEAPWGWKPLLRKNMSFTVRGRYVVDIMKKIGIMGGTFDRYILVI